MAMDLAVPPKKFCEYLRASVSFWALSGTHMKKPVMMRIYVFFMITIVFDSGIQHVLSTFISG
jgi:hypothetical protein